MKDDNLFFLILTMKHPQIFPAVLFAEIPYITQKGRGKSFWAIISHVGARLSESQQDPPARSIKAPSPGIIQKDHRITAFQPHSERTIIIPVQNPLFFIQFHLQQPDKFLLWLGLPVWTPKQTVQMYYRDLQKV